MVESLCVMRFILLFLMAFIISPPAMALDYYEFAPDKCEFAMMFTDKPRRGSVTTSGHQRAETQTLSKRYADSSISIRAACPVVDPQQLRALDEAAIKKQLQRDSKKLSLHKHKIDYKVREGTRWGILTGYRQVDENTSKYIFKYILVGSVSMMTVDAVYKGRHPSLDDHFNGTLATIHVKPY